MIAQELPNARLHRLDRAQYHRLGELGFFDGRRVELIRGIVVDMGPIGPPHASVVDALAEIFFSGAGARATVRVQQPLVAWDESEPEPDLALVPKDRYSERHPDRALLVVEVSESSLEYDRDTKGPLYARSGVPEYWVVDVVGRTVLVHREPSEDGYGRVEHVAAPVTLSVVEFPELFVRVADLFG